MNKQLKQGRPFFVDIANHCIALYEAEGLQFVLPAKLVPKDARDEALRYFERWYTLVGQSFRTRELQKAQGASQTWRNDAAFTLHQATERPYHCVMLVFTLYSPKSHKLGFLRDHAEELASELIAAWPRDDRFSRRCFELPRKAYVNARYSPHYRVSDDELAWLSESVALLRTLVEEVCKRRLKID